MSTPALLLLQAIVSHAVKNPPCSHIVGPILKPLRNAGRDAVSDPFHPSPRRLVRPKDRFCVITLIESVAAKVGNSAEVIDPRPVI